MPRGEPHDECPAVACANCGTLRFLKYPSMTPFGRTGHTFCRDEYRETGEFDEQPWDFTCGAFKKRRRIKNPGKPDVVDAVPVVLAPLGYEPHGAAA